jgi:lysophospholipase L1-like esterase
MKYMPIPIAVILILFTFFQKETNIQALNSQDSILAFGDSLTYGYNAKPSESYPSILSLLSHHRVINAGIPAENSHDGLKRLPALLEDESIKLMILFFGGNDIMQGLSMESLKSNLKTMIHMAKEKNIEVLLISVPNLSLFRLSPLGLYEEVADEENVPLLSGMLADIISKPSLKSDQIHPNALGYKIMAEKIYEKLVELNIILE